MKLLNELNEMSNLSASQKTVLAMTKLSATPKQAYASTTGYDKLVYSRDSLVRLGFITNANGGIMLTPAGENACIQYNLVDEMGQATDEANQLLQAAHQDTEETQNPEDVNQF